MQIEIAQNQTIQQVTTPIHNGLSAETRAIWMKDDSDDDNLSWQLRVSAFFGFHQNRNRNHHFAVISEISDYYGTYGRYGQAVKP